MISYIKKKYDGISKRFKCAEYGIYYLRNADFKISEKLKINGEYKNLKFIDIDSPPFFYEFTEICLNDCYHVKALKKILKNVNSIVDIGSNQGLFAIVARQNFKNADIQCFEPNLQLQSILSENCEKLNAQVYFEAVTKEDCKVSLEFGETELNTQTHLSFDGEVTGTSFKAVIERAGGMIDLLKIDCEGAEWDLFEDELSWRNINALTMEYHLWAKKGSQFRDIATILERLNFKILFHNALSEGFGLVTAINKDLTS